MIVVPEVLKWGGAGKTAISGTRFMRRTWGWGTAFPTTWKINAWFMRTDEDILYQNTGTEEVPVWTSFLGSGS